LPNETLLFEPASCRTPSIGSIAAENAIIGPGIVAWSGRTRARSSKAIGTPKFRIPLREILLPASAIEAPN